MIFIVVAPIAERVRNHIASLGRCLDDRRVKPIGEHCSSTRGSISVQRDCIDTPRRRNLKTLHMPRQRGFVLRLHDQVEMIALDTHMSDSKVIPIGDPLGRLLNCQIGISPSKIADATSYAQHHMNRVPLDMHRTFPVRRPRTRTLGLAPRSPPLPTSSAEQPELLCLSTCHDLTIVIVWLIVN